MVKSSKSSKSTKSSNSFAKLCTPAKIYFAIAVISVIIGLTKKVPFGILFMKILFAFIWTYILGWLCKEGYSGISWILVLLPYIVLILAVLRIANVTQHKALFKSVGLQGAYGEEPMGGMGTMGTMGAMGGMGRREGMGGMKKREGIRLFGRKK